MSELKPCPFCGSPGAVLKGNPMTSDGEQFYYPTCTGGYVCPGQAELDGEWLLGRMSFVLE